MIEASGLSIRGRDGRVLLDQVFLALHPGEVLAVVGPNGAGKSTLLRAMAGELRASSGSVSFAGRRIEAWPARALACRRAVVSQAVALAFPLRVAEVVALGRQPWHGRAGAAQDRRAIATAMEEMGIAALAERAYATLSGGERQRVQTARALAQISGAEAPAFLLLDEPTASLDVRHGAMLLQGLRRLARGGLGVMVVLHELNEAAFVADRVAMLAGARCVALGRTPHVLRPELLEECYGIPFRQAAGGLLPVLGDGPAAEPPGHEASG